MVTTTEYAQLSAAAYESGGAGSTDANWIRLENAPAASPGFSASLYEKRTIDPVTGITVTEIVIAYRGTDGPFDAVADIQLVAGQPPTPPQQFNDAVKYYNDVKALYPDSSISVTGHSLGGAMASYVAAKSPDQPTATAFNAPGIANVVGAGNYTNVTNYNTFFDPVSNLTANQIGAVNTVIATTVGGLPSWFGAFIGGLGVPGAAAVIAGVINFLLGQHSIASMANVDFTAAQRFIPRRDPLTLDLNNNGIETIPPNLVTPILFDHEGNGIKTGTGWIAPSDGFLALDRNGNGSIDDGTELFGDNTNLYDADGTVTGKAADGFDALAQQDSNGDGVVNSQDAHFADLRVWQDLNQDGISDAGELKTLAELGIASINVTKTENSRILPGGNEIADLGTFTRTDGTTGSAGVSSRMADVNLASDTFHRSFTDVIPTTAQTATLPDMQGSGAVRDLRQAASIQTAEGAALATTLAQFALTDRNDVFNSSAIGGFARMRTAINDANYNNLFEREAA